MIRSPFLYLLITLLVFSCTEKTSTHIDNKNLKEEVNSVQTELQSTKEQLEQILKNKKMFVKKIDELSQETDAMLGEFDKW